MISDEDFYGGRTGPLEKFFIYLFINDFEDFTVAGRGHFIYFFIYLIF